MMLCRKIRACVVFVHKHRSHRKGAKNAKPVACLKQISLRALRRCGELLAFIEGDRLKDQGQSG
jgi:hypothetical protein